jgi:hypothetical protein
MSGDSFVDSNIWLYAFMDESSPKRNCQRIPPSATELPWFGRVKGVSVEKESDERGPRADRPHAPDSRRGRESGRS